MCDPCAPLAHSGASCRRRDARARRDRRRDLPAELSARRLLMSAAAGDDAAVQATNDDAQASKL